MGTLAILLHICTLLFFLRGREFFRSSVSSDEDFYFFFFKISHFSFIDHHLDYVHPEKTFLNNILLFLRFHCVFFKEF